MADIPVVEVVDLDAVLDALEDPTSSEVFSAAEPFSNHALAASAAARAINGGGGGSQPIQVVRVPLSFDTPHLQAESFAITAADSIPKRFTFAVDVSDFFSPTDDLVVTGSTGNDGTYTVATVAVNEITVVEAVSDETGDGVGSTTNQRGVPVYTPAPGDVFLFAVISTSEAFDGQDDPTIELGWLDDIGALAGFTAVAEDQPYNAHLSDTGAAAAGTTLTAGDTAKVFTDTTPLRATLDNSNGLYPGSTVGACELVIGIVKAA